MSRRSISKGLRFDVLNRDGFRCRYCGADADTSVLHVDHRFPVALGGGNAIDNLITACEACNLGKRTKLANLDDELSEYGIECPFAEGWPHDIEEPVYFINETWAITDFGIERIKVRYEIPYRELGLCAPRDDDRRLSLWLTHLCMKKWVSRRFSETVEAVTKAIRHHQVRVEFDWKETIDECHRMLRRSGVNPETGADLPRWDDDA